MMMNIRLKYIIIWLIVLILNVPSGLIAVESYDVHFEGVEDAETLLLLQKSSRLVSLQNEPPETNAGLKRRADADLINLAKALQSLAYYDSHIDLTIDFKKNPVDVLFKISLGPVYTFANFDVVPQFDPDKPVPRDPFAFETLYLETLGILLETPATPKTIIEAEETLLEILEKSGYPLAQIVKKDIHANQCDETITVRIYVDSGPLCYFGTTTVNGNCKVLEEFFTKKIAWHETKVFDITKVEKTQNALEASGLFSTISVTHADTVDENGELPMVIEVTEGKQRSVGLGLSYTTQWGAGVSGEWENRNIRGLGEKLGVKTNIWQRQQEGTVYYLKPDFYHRGQDLLWLAQLQREETLAFTDSSFSLSGQIQKQIHDHTRLSYGLMYKYIHDTRTDNKRIYNLVKIPLQIRWNNSNNLLDPTLGTTANLKLIPSLQVVSPRFFYAISTFTGSAYYPLNESRSWVFAAKINLGSIIGAPRHAIPPSERFYAGSDTLLRGYRFMTVSPLRECHRKPEGGRSLMVYSFETRWRYSETLGLVLFYDFGNVYKSTFPDFTGRIRQSVGLGARYHTPVGPLRLDVAFPLNRRKHLDHLFQIYLSIGQAF